MPLEDPQLLKFFGIRSRPKLLARNNKLVDKIVADFKKGMESEEGILSVLVNSPRGIDLSNAVGHEVFKLIVEFSRALSTKQVVTDRGSFFAINSDLLRTILTEYSLTDEQKQIRLRLSHYTCLILRSPEFACVNRTIRLKLLELIQIRGNSGLSTMIFTRTPRSQFVGMLVEVGPRLMETVADDGWTVVNQVRKKKKK